VRPESILPPTPSTKVQVFELGWQAAYFAEHCGGKERESAGCQESLRKAGQALDAAGPLTPEQLQGERAYMAKLDARLSVSDRVLGFFTFVNIIWLVAIIGIIATVGPCVAYLCGPFLMKYATILFEEFLRPIGKRLHRWGVFEAISYLLSLFFSVQGSRYPPGSDAGTMVALPGGLAFLPCWAYSTALHTSGEGDSQKFLMVSHAIAASILVPLAVIHDSQLIGFFAVLAVYGALGFVFLAFGFGFLIGFDGKDSLQSCLVASIVLIVGFTGMRVVGMDPTCVRPFALGGIVLGNVMYFLALLILSAGWRLSARTYWARQAAMISSLVVAILLGSTFAIPSMRNTACTFMVLYLMEKELEINWHQGLAVVAIFLNFVGLFVLSLWLTHHPSFIASMLDPTGIYM
jgi:hypothetical protein